MGPNDTYSVDQWGAPINYEQKAPTKSEMGIDTRGQLLEDSRSGCWNIKPGMFPKAQY